MLTRKRCGSRATTGISCADSGVDPPSHPASTKATAESVGEASQALDIARKIYVRRWKEHSANRRELTMQLGPSTRNANLESGDNGADALGERLCGPPGRLYEPFCSGVGLEN